MSKFYPIHPNAEKAIEKLIGVSTSKHPTRDGFYFTQQVAPNTWRIGFASNDGRRKLLPEMEFPTSVPANTAARGLAAKGPLTMPKAAKRKPAAKKAQPKPTRQRKASPKKSDTPKDAPADCVAGG